MFLKAYDVVLLFLQKKLIFVLGVPHGDPILQKLGQKIAIFKRF